MTTFKMHMTFQQASYRIETLTEFTDVRALTYLSGEAPGPGEPAGGPTTPVGCVGGAGVGPPVLVL
jgi:hypothetical protein